ncbi:MAG: DUF1579 domain-containing protein [Armatimonadota bacterium]|nr:DUF1579 domain-containing protein [Armatimonadota bacterium]
METKDMEQSPMFAKPQKEHEWLQKFVGEWTSEMHAMMPDGESQSCPGSESVRSMSGMWIVAEGKGSMPDGDPTTMLLTLGYDPKKGYVGSWVGSMMGQLWTYEGTLEGNKLTLSAEGPRFDGEGTALYHDIHEFVDDNHRIMRSEVKGDDGNWTEFMVAHYHRK